MKRARMINIYSDGGTIGKNVKFGVVKEVCLGVYIPDLGIERSVKTDGLSNNEAEFKALILAMEIAILHGVKRARFNMDSKIIKNRAQGARPKNKKYQNSRMDKFQDRVLELKEDFIIAIFNWIPRESNERADLLANIGKKQKNEWI